ncbi:hypothetical protein [Sphingomonas sp. MS122]|uniref:hypothetical protein n=1 Tax=Sphingomonas sp. MS122 TaxID=3412683 RepID=UPI003C2BB3AD
MIDEAADAEVEIALAAPDVARSDRIYRFEGDALCFTAPGIAEYRCRSARIDVTPHPAASETEVAAMLIATALPALLWMRGRFVLHAAAAQLPGWDRAIAIAGASGSGKSTILAQLVAAGGSIVGDDTIVIDTAERLGEASGLAGGYFLGGGQGAARDFHPVPRDRSLARAPLGAILVLSRGDAGAAQAVARLAPVEAVAQLLVHRHRPRVPALLGRHMAILADSALLARTIPLYSWSYSAGTGELAAWEWAALARCAGAGGSG